MPEITNRVLKPGDEVALDAFLLPRIESSMFLLGNSRSAGLVDRGERIQGTYAAAFDGAEIVGVVSHNGNGGLLLQAPNHVLDLCRTAAGASGRKVKLIVGPADQAFRVRDTLAQSGANFQMESLEKLYRLELDRLVVPSILATGIVRGRSATEADAERLIQWRVAYSVETMNERETQELWAQSRKSIDRALSEGRLWLLEAGDETVAMSAFNTVAGHAVQVGGVYTPPQWRHRGYARAVVAHSLLDARAAGATLGVLFTDENNIGAHRAYTSLGFEIVGEYAIVLLRSPIRYPSVTPL